MEIKEILSKVDHTLLKQEATWEDIKAICDDGMLYNTASVCIPPSYVRKAVEYIIKSNSNLKVCTVIGFPNGYNTTQVKCFETADAIENGADEIDMVVGGFHLYNPPTRKYESDETIDSVVISLNQKGSIYYTCHCTGPKAYKRMKAVMGDKMKYLSTGTEIIK